MQSFTKTVCPGSTAAGPTKGRVFAKIEYKVEDGRGRLSITGVVGPKSNGNCWGSCGQILDSMPVVQFNKGWDAATLSRFRKTWKEWHLNDIRAYCSHQRHDPAFQEALKRKYATVTLSLTDEAREQQRSLRQAIELAFISHMEQTDATEDEILLLSLEGSRPLTLPVEEFEPIRSNEAELLARLPERLRPFYRKSSISSVDYNTGNWISYKKDPKRGCLGKPCPVCGYEYGSAWVYEEVPEDVLEWLESLPDSECKPAWV